MADHFSYHSPQFSEEIVWLPPWLHPHRIQMVDRQNFGDDQNAPLVGSKISGYPLENAYDKQNGKNAMQNGRYTGCILHLSGEDGTAGSISTDKNELHFSLCLSSIDSQQQHVSQGNDRPEIMKATTYESSYYKRVTDNALVIGEKNSRNCMHQIDCEPSKQVGGQLGHKPAARLAIVSDCKCKSCECPDGKVNFIKLKDADMNNAIEMVIAASEAMVIKDIVLNSCQTNILPVGATALEAALRIKQARRQFLFEDSEYLCHPEEDSFENDVLSDLDETSMADAFADVGLPAVFPEDTGPIQSCFDDTHQGKMKRQQLLQACTPPRRTVDDVDGCLGEKNLLHRRQTLEEVKDWIVKAPDLPQPTLFQGGLVTSKRDVSIWNNIKKLFDLETSFVTESVESMELCEMVGNCSNETTASSRTLLAFKVMDSSKTNDFVSCLDLTVVPESSSLPDVDPLCSAVPCSISRDDLLVSDAMDLHENENDKFCSLEDAPPFLMSLCHGEKTDPASRRMKHCSLGPYSAIVPSTNIVGNGVIPSVRLSTDSVAIKGYTAHPTPDLEKKICEDSSHTKPMDCVENPGYKGGILPAVLSMKKRIQAGDMGLNNNFRGGNINGQNGKCERSNSFFAADGKHSHENKKVRFLETKFCDKQRKPRGRMLSKNSQGRQNKAPKSKLEARNKSRVVLRGFEFLLTGFSARKEKEMETLIRNFGGYVLLRVPPCSDDLKGRGKESQCQRLLIILSPRKVCTTKFLYGCATDSLVLNAQWLVDSIQVDSLLPIRKYLLRQHQTSWRKGTFLFSQIGFLLYGEVRFCRKFSNIIEHGGGQLYTSLQALVTSLNDKNNRLGIILVENETSAPRQLKHYGLEKNIQTMPVRWIVQSLFLGKLLPFKLKRLASSERMKISVPNPEEVYDMSPEI